MHPSDEEKRPPRRTATITYGIESLNLGLSELLPVCTVLVYPRHLQLVFLSRTSATFL